MSAQELEEQANAQLQCNDIQAANNTLQQLSELLPDDINVLSRLAWTYLTLGNHHTAITLYEKTLAINPDWIDANYHLAMLFGQMGEMKKARQYFSRVLRTDPNHFYALLKLAYLEYIEGKTLVTMSLLNKAKKIDPDSVELNIRFGRLYTAMNEFDNAIKHFSLALKFDEGNTDAIGQLASLYSYEGDSEKALAMLQPFLDKDELDPSIAIVLADICRSIGRCEEAKLYLEKILESDIGNLPRSGILFALGKIYDRDQDFEKAFKAYKEANDLNNFAYNSWEEKQMVLAVKEKLTPEFVQKLPKAKKLGKSPKPIFIVGMPRSGTSLVEQIISSHPQVHGAGERMEISIIANSLQSDLQSSQPYPFCLSQITSSLLTAKAKQYIKEVSAKAPSNAKFITDKMPDNYSELVLIRQLFPKARIIHCVRDPRDNCLSCYFTQLMGNAYSYDLKSLGEHYNLYEVTMDNMKRVLKAPIFEVKYEDLVSDTEKVSREIIKYCGLDWDDRCLEFHKNKRNVVTASSDQVRQPIYKQSVARWKNYEPYIGDLIRSLERKI